MEFVAKFHFMPIILSVAVRTLEAQYVQIHFILVHLSNIFKLDHRNQILEMVKKFVLGEKVYAIFSYTRSNASEGTQ